MTTDADVVAIIHADGKRVATWHVVIDPGWPMGRLCGAWVFDTASPSLVATHLLLPFGGVLPDDLAGLAGVSTGLFDPAASREAIAKEIAEIEALHGATPTKAGKPRAALDWPSLPEPLDWSALPSPPRGVVDDELTSVVVAVANWVADLADAWAAIETIRLSREHLRGDVGTVRPLPAVLAEMLA